MNVPSRFRRLAPALLIALLYAGLLFRFARTQFGGNITGFSYISRNYPAPTIWNDQTLVRNDDGYDGMFYYYIAHDPFIRTKVYTYFMDGWTAYRYQRVAYPLLVHIISLGQKDWIPWMMVIANLVMVGLGVFFISLIAEHHGRSAWWGLVYGLCTGLFIGVTRNLTEPTQMAMLLGAVYWYGCRNNIPYAVLFLSIASLSKDTSLLLSMTFLLYEFWKTRNWKNALCFTVPGLIYMAWQYYVYLNIGELGLSTGVHSQYRGTVNMEPYPLVRFIQVLTDRIKNFYGPLRPTHETWDLTLIISHGVAMLFSFLALKSWKHVLSIPLIVYGAFILFISGPWLDPNSYSRTALPLMVFFIPHFLATGSWFSLVPIGLNAISYFILLKCAAVI